jgi:hypothetical protein
VLLLVSIKRGIVKPSVGGKCQNLVWQNTQSYGYGSGVGSGKFLPGRIRNNGTVSGSELFDKKICIFCKVFLQMVHTFMQLCTV